MGHPINDERHQEFTFNSKANTTIKGDMLWYLINFSFRFTLANFRRFKYSWRATYKSKYIIGRCECLSSIFCFNLTRVQESSQNDHNVCKMSTDKHTMVYLVLRMSNKKKCPRLTFCFKSFIMQITNKINRPIQYLYSVYTPLSTAMKQYNTKKT